MVVGLGRWCERWTWPAAPQNSTQQHPQANAALPLVEETFLRRPCTSPSHHPKRLDGSFLLPFRSLPNCTRFGTGHSEHQLGCCFFFFENISLKDKTRMFGARFSKIPRCWCVSFLPAKQFTPFLQGQQVFYPSQRQTNEGTEDVRSLAQTDSSWQQEDLAVADWLMLLMEKGTLRSLSVLW